MKKRFPIIFPTGSYNSLINNPQIIATNDFIYQKLIPLILSHLTSEKKEGRVLEMGCDCVSLYPLLEKIHMKYSELTSYGTPGERYKIYFEIHRQMLSNRTYEAFYKAFFNLYAKIVAMYDIDKPVESYFNNPKMKGLISTLFLSFRFHSSLQSVLFQKVINRFYSKINMKEVQFILCGIPLKECPFYLGISEGLLPKFCSKYYFTTPFQDEVLGKRINAVVYFLGVPIYIEWG